ncbi:MAG: hypothetical protein H0U04_05630 [Rubrobacter sp.]|nr:hypothetical protein [Rubrobacter sp.]
MTSPQPTSEIPSLTCPSCETDELRPLSQVSARCVSCGCLLNGTALQTLRQIVALPDVVGGHACECGHPEMRRLPDGVFRCPSCGSEVLPPSHAKLPHNPEHHTKAYWTGWLDGRYGETVCFTGNEHLQEWENHFDRLDYYRGHRAGNRDRRMKHAATPEAA